MFHIPWVVWIEKETPARIFKSIRAALHGDIRQHMGDLTVLTFNRFTRGDIQATRNDEARKSSMEIETGPNCFTQPKLPVFEVPMGRKIVLCQISVHHVIIHIVYDSSIQ